MSESSNSDPEAPTLGAALVDALADRGARAVFALPGDFVVPLLREFRRVDRLPIHTLSHEPAVGFAADGAARLGGGLGVACVTYGAGALNLVNAIANAWAEQVPLVLISGAPGRDELAGHAQLIHHQVKSLASQLAVMRELTCAQAVLDEPQRAHDEIARVLDLSLALSRPVYLEVPRDLVTCPTRRVRRPSPAQPSSLPAHAAESAYAALRSAKRPLFLLDLEVRRFGLEADVASIASTLGAPVLTTLSGRGLLAGSGLVHGTWHGNASDNATAGLFDLADLIVALGVIRSDTNLAGATFAPDLDPRIILANDGEVAMGGVTSRVPLAEFVRSLRWYIDRGTTHLVAHPAPLRVHRPRLARPPSNEPLTVDDVAVILAEFLENHGPHPVVSDIGDCLFASIHLEDVEILAPAYYATVGYGIPAALGAMVVTGRRPLVLVGDGAFQMTGFELASAVRLGLDPIIVVFDNQSWDMVKAFDRECPSHGLHAIRFDLLAETLGAVGHLVTDCTQLEVALHRAHQERGRPHVLHVQLAKDSRSRALTRFVSARRPQSNP